ncbi:Pentatricopeptide repeat-containing protein [Apostasia shenzhenica]|uniref:Pentatricopeptide repeat-containing protein n=1 Tax=Apostasia shenzhenica TaxID=1088818 RepID=A0A2I0AJL9_9ASPA|nr:Pentatricopeptide repeat-containing protein [Apostasia shenzhenica]
MQLGLSIFMVLSKFQKTSRIASNVCTNYGFRFLSGALNSEAIIRTLKWCRETQSLINGQSFHAQVIKYGLLRNVFVANSLISMYSYLNLCCHARELFDEMPERSVVTWTAMISSYTHVGDPVEAIKMFRFMLDEGLEKPNCYTFSAVLNACAIIGDLDMGKWVHDCIRRVCLHSDTVLMNAVLDMYVKCDCLVEAKELFDKICARNLVSWNTMISGYCNVGKMLEAENLFFQMTVPDVISFNTMVAGFAKQENPRALFYLKLMHQKGFQLDDFTLPFALKICGCLGIGEMGKQLHGYIIRCGYESSIFIGPALLDMYGNFGEVHLSVKLLDELLGERSSTHRLHLLNSMLSVYSNNGYNELALDLVSKTHSSEAKLDAFTLSSALKVCINSNAFRIGIQIHGLIIAKGYHVDDVIGSVLVELYAKCGFMEEAVKIFLGLSQKDLISWTGMVNCCIQQGINQLAFSLFRAMLEFQCKLDNIIVSVILKACAALSWIHGGQQAHALCIKNGFGSESVIFTSLIEIYSKCGEIEDALTLFGSSSEKDIVTWTVMILGCGCNGRTDEAIKLFNQMLESGEEPNEITFLGILSACRHGGLVREASSFFEAMEKQHGIKPSLEHYCCMVDILSRAGFFEEAKLLIFDMPFEANQTIWNSLIGSSNLHQNVDVGKLSLDKLLLNAGNDASMVISMCNVYASLNMWEYSAEMRELARSIGKNEPGRSWIEAR